VRSLFVAGPAGRLHVVDYGGTGPPLVLSHGTGLCARVWDPVAPLLAGDFHVWALDRRGHGDSDKPPEGHGLGEVAGDHEAMAAALGLVGAAALGHSAGATTLGLAAARRPELFARIVMVDPIVFGDAGRPSEVRERAAGFAERVARRRAEWPSAGAMRESLAARPPFDRWAPAALEAYVRHGAAEQPDGRVVLKCPPALEAVMYRHAPGLDLFAELARVPVPVLVLRGARTDRFPRASAERLVAGMAAARLAELPGVGHFAPMEDPALVARHARPFLRGGRGAGAAGDL
jgi:pimeloyl-ACP methyl ester carboxylesterase